MCRHDESSEHSVDIFKAKFPSLLIRFTTIDGKYKTIQWIFRDVYLNVFDSNL